MKKRIFNIQNHSCSQLQENPFLFEIAMEEYVIEHPEILWLSDDLSSPSVIGHEIAKERKRYDIVAQYGDTTAVVEAKKGVLDKAALEQLLMYLELDNGLEEPFEGNVIGILLGTSINSEIIQQVEKSTNLYAIVLSRFDAGNLESISTTIYEPKTSNRDLTKYTLTDLQGNTIRNLGKGTLVYEIIRSYIEENPQINLPDLQKEFPKSSVGRRAKSSQEIVRRNDLSEDDNLYIRYFKKPLVCADGEFLVSNQWGIRNIQPMIDIAIKIGMTIKSH